MLKRASFPSWGQFDVASRTDDRKQVSDEQWFIIEDLFPWGPPSEYGGRPTRAYVLFTMLSLWRRTLSLRAFSRMAAVSEGTLRARSKVIPAFRNMLIVV